MPQTRGVITHAIGFSWDVTGQGIVAVVALVDAVEAQQVGCWAGGGCGVLVVPDYVGYVVTEGSEGAAPEGDLLGQDIVMGYLASQL